MTTRSKHRIQTIYNRTQLKKNIQRNKKKKELKQIKSEKKSKMRKFKKNLCHILFNCIDLLISNIIFNLMKISFNFSIA